jgi:heme exporter protein D
VLLVQRFGHAFGYWLMAGGLSLIGVVATIAVSVKQQQEVCSPR